MYHLKYKLKFSHWENRTKISFKRSTEFQSHTNNKSPFSKLKSPISISKSPTIDQKQPCTDQNLKNFRESLQFLLDLTMKSNHLPNSLYWNSDVWSYLKKLTDLIIKCQLLIVKKLKSLDIWLMLKIIFKNLMLKSINFKSIINNHQLPPIQQLDQIVPFKNLMFNLLNFKTEEKQKLPQETWESSSYSKKSTDLITKSNILLLLAIHKVHFGPYNKVNKK